MVPSGRNTTSRKKTRTRTRRKQARSHFKKRIKQETSSSSTASSSSSSTSSSKKRVIDSNDVAVCSTPKGQKFRIPEISTCPPAPKKPRVLSSNCSLRRSPLTFFSPPDLEIFFCVALRDVPISSVC